jgi:hypothetical protein
VLVVRRCFDTDNRDEPVALIDFSHGGDSCCPSVHPSVSDTPPQAKMQRSAGYVLDGAGTNILLGVTDAELATLRGKVRAFLLRASVPARRPVLSSGWGESSRHKSPAHACSRHAPLSHNAPSVCVRMYVCVRARWE